MLRLLDQGDARVSNYTRTPEHRARQSEQMRRWHQKRRENPPPVPVFPALDLRGIRGDLAAVIYKGVLVFSNPSKVDLSPLESPFPGGDAMP